MVRTGAGIHCVKDDDMKTTLVIATLLMTPALTPTLAMADTPGADWIPAEQVISKLKSAGYTAIHSIEADDGRWEVDAVKDGKVFDVDVDPRSGNVTRERLKR